MANLVYFYCKYIGKRIILLIKGIFPGLCNGSTRDFGSLCLGSNPGPGEFLCVSFKKIILILLITNL